MSLSDYAENALLDELVGKTAFVMPTVWVGLSTANPGDNAAGLNEPATANGYARVATAGLWAVASGGSITNATAITFAANSTADWGTVTHFALFDNATRATGNMLCYGALTQAKSIVVGDVPKFAIGAIVITMD